jgi:hypothetical protein
VDRNLLLAFALSFVVLSVWTMMQPPRRSRRRRRRPRRLADPPRARLAQPRPARPRQRRRAERAAGRPRESIAIARPLYLARAVERGRALRDWELTQYRDRHGDPIRS